MTGNSPLLPIRILAKRHVQLRMQAIVDSVVSEGFDALPVVGVGDDGSDGNGDDIEQEMLATVDAAWVAKSTEVMPQAKGFENHDPSSVRDA